MALWNGLADRPEKPRPTSMLCVRLHVTSRITPWPVLCLRHDADAAGDAGGRRGGKPRWTGEPVALKGFGPQVKRCQTSNVFKCLPMSSNVFKVLSLVGALLTLLASGFKGGQWHRFGGIFARLSDQSSTFPEVYLQRWIFCMKQIHMRSHERETGRKHPEASGSQIQPQANKRNWSWRW